MEQTGIPTTPTQVVPTNAHFNVAAARSLYARNPARFDARQPVLGGLFSSNRPEAGYPQLTSSPQTPTSTRSGHGSAQLRTNSIESTPTTAP